MKKFALALCLVLAGCGSMLDDYRPYAVEVHDQAAFDRDVVQCRKYAQDYNKGFDAADVGTEAARGFVSNAAGGAVTPLVPVIGGLGGAGTGVIESLDMTGITARKILVKCLEKKGDRSGAYLTLDPAN